MKNMDFRSLIIGLLCGVCMFLVMGQNRNNMGDIIVSSITVKNPSGIETMWIGSSAHGFGFLEIYNTKGDKTIYLGTAQEGFGFMETFKDLQHKNAERTDE